jgi:hypothetical protein
MEKNGIKVVINALWSIVSGMSMPDASQSERPKTLTGDVKFDLTISKGDEHERKN